MTGYTKLFHSILASTIWRADDKTRIVWITLLAMADRHGICEGSVPGLADFARVSIPDCRAALAALMAPDEESRSKECEGRRIEEIEGGWRLINHAKYRQKLSADERREYLKVKQREHRSKKKSTSVNNVSDTLTESTHTEAAPDPKAKEEAIQPRLKQRPLPGFNRLRIFRWLIDDMTGMLGDHVESFDLEGWLQSIDENGAIVIPANQIPWLKTELELECRRRGLFGSIKARPSRDCPHTPPCVSPGNWQCQQRTVLEEARR
jgi:hypothetical protein